MNYSIEAAACRRIIQLGPAKHLERVGRAPGSVAPSRPKQGRGRRRQGAGAMVTGESLFSPVQRPRGRGNRLLLLFPANRAGSCSPARHHLPEIRLLCATHGVELAVHFQKKLGAGMVGGEGFIMQRITGPGMVFLEVDGYCQEYDLQPGEPLVCDTGVLAIMDATCQMDVQMVKGVKNMLLGGEGLFDTVITGPGKVYLQTMRIPAIAKLMAPYLAIQKVIQRLLLQWK